MGRGEEIENKGDVCKKWKIFGEQGIKVEEKRVEWGRGEQRGA